MKKIVLTEDQLNRLVEMKHKNVFKDEHKMKDAVESHLSEEKKVCGCGCEIGKCDCGPECTKCDCGKKKLSEQSEPMDDDDSFYAIYNKKKDEVREYIKSYRKAKKIFDFIVGDLENPPIGLRKVDDHFEEGFEYCVFHLTDTENPKKCFKNRKDADLFICNYDKPFSSFFMTKKVPVGSENDEKEQSEDWDPTGSVGVNGVAQDVARKGMNTMWENKEIILKDFKRFL